MSFRIEYVYNQTNNNIHAKHTSKGDITNTSDNLTFLTDT